MDLWLPRRGVGGGWAGSSGLVKKLYFNLRKDPDLTA